MAELHAETGCYGDGALGHQHTREACADVLDHYADANFRSRGLPVPDAAGKQTVEDLARELRGEMSDDAYEESVADEWLNKHAPFTGCYWGWRDGDFGLWQSPVAVGRRGEVMTAWELDACCDAIEELIQRQPGCALPDCTACRANEERAKLARAAIARLRVLEAR